MNFQILGKKEYSNCETAIVAFVRCMFSTCIDGIDVNYDS